MTPIQVKLYNLVVLKLFLVISRKAAVRRPVVENIVNISVVNWFTVAHQIG